MKSRLLTILLAILGIGAALLAIGSIIGGLAISCLPALFILGIILFGAFLIWLYVKWTTR